jgi:putative oxidoreductase
MSTSASNSFPAHPFGPSPMSLSLWAAQALGALTVGNAALVMLTKPVPEVVGRLGGWLPVMSEPNTHRLGFILLLAAFGVVAPSLARIAPWVSAVAAAGLALALLGAAFVHGFRGELLLVLVDLALFATMVFIAWGRTFKAPIVPHAHIRC